MALECIPADIGPQGGVSRMSDPDKIERSSKSCPCPSWQRPGLATFLCRTRDSGSHQKRSGGSPPQKGAGMVSILPRAPARKFKRGSPSCLDPDLQTPVLGVVL
jgi:hypothetical protein